MTTSLHRRVAYNFAVLLSLGCASAVAQVTGIPQNGHTGLTQSSDVINNLVVPRSGQNLTLNPPLIPLNLGLFDIVINPGPGLAANPPALAAFERAAQSWEARFTDPITITIDADIKPLGAGIIGNTSLVTLAGGYDFLRSVMIADAADEPSNGIVSFIPTGANFHAAVPGPVITPGHAQDSFDGDIVATKANLKALGFLGLDGAVGATDAVITFNTNFAFDYDNSDGVGGSLLDFQTTAAHEIGHALGFFSIVDTLNSVEAGAVPIPPLDLFRFADGTADDPSTALEFSTFNRNFVPGVNAITDQILGPTPEFPMSTGALDPSFDFPGRDGRQASHWKDNLLTGNFIGLMDPTLNFGESYGPQDSDFRALDLIGYDLAPIPEGTSMIAGLALVSLVGWRVLRKI